MPSKSSDAELDYMLNALTTACNLYREAIAPQHQKNSLSGSIRAAGKRCWRRGES
jgi:hypothetical protein